MLQSRYIFILCSYKLSFYFFFLFPMNSVLKNSLALMVSAVAVYSVVTMVTQVNASPYTWCGYGYDNGSYGYAGGTDGEPVYWFLGYSYGFWYGSCPTTSTTTTTTSAGGWGWSTPTTTTPTTTTTVTTWVVTTGVVSTVTTASGTVCTADVAAHIAMRKPKLTAVGYQVYGVFSGRYVKYNKEMRRVFAVLKAMPEAERNAKIDMILARILCMKANLTGDVRHLVQFIEDNMVMMR